jgi:hypothetical protein
MIEPWLNYKPWLSFDDIENLIKCWLNFNLLMLNLG